MLDAKVSNATDVNVAGRIEVGLFAQKNDVLVECFDVQNQLRKEFRFTDHFVGLLSLLDVADQTVHFVG